MDLGTHNGIPLDHRLTNKEFVRVASASDNAFVRHCAERLKAADVSREVDHLREEIDDLENELTDKAREIATLKNGLIEIERKNDALSNEIQSLKQKEPSRVS
ncbi:MAG: hypothetical protein AAGF48_13000 [Pseudomonadota bacterium]